MPTYFDMGEDSARDDNASYIHISTSANTESMNTDLTSDHTIDNTIHTIDDTIYEDMKPEDWSLANKILEDQFERAFELQKLEQELKELPELEYKDV